jgi:hypothetical protein
MKTLVTITLLLPVMLATAQNYRCDWSVAGLGGGDMSSTTYRAGATVGQTAVGQIAGTAYQAFIGFWQIDTASTGIMDEAHWSAAEPLVTMLYAPYPNPGPGFSNVRYSLASEATVSLQLFDLSGRAVRTLVNSAQPAGRYGVRLGTWDLARGVYFVKLSTPVYQVTRKIVLE